MVREIGPRRLFIVCLAGLLLFVLWSFAIPIFESPDEPAHWLNARYIHDYLRLPPYDPTYYEGNQAPLYYIVMAPFAFADPGAPLGRCGVRLYLNCPSDLWNHWPIRVVRLLTAVLSVITVLFTILAAFEATQKRHLGFLAGVFVACLPQFSFRASTVNNDAMVAAFSAVATYFLVRFLRKDEWRMALWCSVASGAAFLSKVNAAIFPVVFGAAILAEPLPWKTRLSRLRVLVLAAFIILPWIIHNWFVYGDAVSENAMARTVPLLFHPQSIRALYFRTEFPSLVFRSFIGCFGWMSLYLSDYLYCIYAGIAAVGGLGLLYGVIRRKLHTRVVLGLLSLMVLCGMLLVRLNLAFPQPQGRLLFPALTPFMVLLAMGFGVIPSWNDICTGVLSTILLALNIYIVTNVVAPAFWKPDVPPENLDVLVSDKLMKGPAPAVLSAGRRFTESFVSEHDYLHAVEIEVTHYARTLPRQGLIRVSLREGGIDVKPLATTEVPASGFQSCCMYARIQFPPILSSRGKLYYVSVETEGLPENEMVTVFLSDRLVYPPGRFYIDGMPREQNTSFRTFYLECIQCSKTF